MDNEFLIPLVLFGSMLLLVLVGMIAAFMIIHKQRVGQYRLRLKEARYHYENELLRTRMEVQEQGLERVSREIHDNVGQVLSITRMQLQHAVNKKTKAEMTALMLESAGLIGKSIRDLRNLSHVLNGGMIEKVGLCAAIEKELLYIRSLYEMEVAFSCPEEFPALRPAEDLLLFRITQEALNNMLRHAEASIVTITLSYTANILRLRIADNGVGMETSCESKGLGIASMRQRAKLLGGMLNIRSEAGQGTSVTITMKMKEDEKQ